MKLSKDDFINHIKSVLPELLDINDDAIKIEEMAKFNVSYTGMSIQSSEPEAIKKIADIDEAYSQYNGNNMTEVLNKLQEFFKEKKELPDYLNVKLDDYGEIKDKLYIRVCNAGRNEEFLKTHPHKKVEDLAITYHILLDVSDAIASAAITNEMLDLYGISKETLHEDAINNAKNILPGDSILMLGRVHIITNFTGEHYGFATIFTEPRLLKEAAKDLNVKELIILPASVHEAIVQPYEESELERYKATVREINGSSLIKSDIFLSDNIYRYNVETGEFKIE